MRLDSALKDLERRLPGRVAAPGSPGWESARQVFAWVGRRRSPLASVRPADRSEVAAVLAWASDAGVKVSPRSGGHAFDGFSIQDDTILLDLRDLNQATLRPDGRFEVMPAVTNIGVAEVLGPKDRALPVGDCPTVGLGGLITGGGFGYAGRLFGLTCDLLVEATVARPDGSLVRAAADENADLFWACRGGGGTAGVVTDMVLETHPVARITTVSIAWRWAEAHEALALHARCIGEAPRKLDLKLKIRTTGADRFFDTASAGVEGSDAGTPLVHLDGEYMGARAEAEELLRPLLTHSAVISSDIQEQSFHDAEATLTPLGILADPAPATIRPCRVASDFTADQFDGDGAETIIRFVEALQNDPDLHGGAVIVEPSGGRIAEIPTDSSAFAHRHAANLVEWEMFYDLPLTDDMRARHDDLLGRTRSDLGDRLTGGRYVNYADMLDTPEHWWGANLPKLEDIARKTDPSAVVASRLNRAG